jgi:hypothetical protein
MFLEFFTLLIFGIVGLSFVLWYRSLELLNHKIADDRELIMSMIKKINVVGLDVIEATQRISNHQNYLDEKMDALARLVDEHSTSVTFTEEQFNLFARADVLAARREELLRTKELKIALERLMGIAMTSRQPPAPNDIIALEYLNQRIEELGDAINDIKN